MFCVLYTVYIFKYLVGTVGPNSLIILQTLKLQNL